MSQSTIVALFVLFRAVPSVGDFEIDRTQSLQLTWQGAPLVTGDFLGVPDELTKADDWKAADIPGGKAVNVYRSSSD